nr:MAG TPA: hypothetical protein [Caudoviricetes sp.]
MPCCIYHINSYILSLRVEQGPFGRRYRVQIR